MANSGRSADSYSYSLEKSNIYPHHNFYANWSGGDSVGDYISECIGKGGGAQCVLYYSATGVVNCPEGWEEVNGVSPDGGPWCTWDGPGIQCPNTKGICCRPASVPTATPMPTQTALVTTCISEGGACTETSDCCSGLFCDPNANNTCQSQSEAPVSTVSPTSTISAGLGGKAQSFISSADIDGNGRCTLLGDWQVILNRYGEAYQGAVINAVTVTDFITCYSQG